MIETEKFFSSEHFLSWWEELQPSDDLDMQEAMTIFFNLETYDLGAL